MSTLRTPPRLVAIIAVAILAAAAVQTGAARASVTALTVAQAIATQGGGSGSVTGYVAGEPISTTTVNRSGWGGDTAIAIDVTGSLSPYLSTHAGLTSPMAMTISGDIPTPPTPASTTSRPSPLGGSDTDAYYANALGRSGADLKAALHTIIKTQTVLSYDEVWTALQDTDQDPANTNDVIEIYSGRSIPKSSNGGDPDDWNREHVYAKSHGDFGTTPGPGTDVHHLRPEDVSVNGARGNLDFDNGGSAVAQCTGCLADADSFQPRDVVKGDVARMTFYMAVRYSGDDGFADLEVNDSVNNGAAPDIGRLSVLKAWSDADPPDAVEQRRNEVIYTTWQHNRNPFIDHPEWVDSIWP